MNTYKWLLKREYWENRGSLLWAPVSTAAVVLFLVFVAFVIGELGLRRVVMVNDLPIGQFTQNLGPAELALFGEGVTTGLYVMSMVVWSVLSVALFFYLIGALFDDRRDRSILFWKSLPISDLDTVVSKVITALVVGPLVAIVVAVALMLGILLVGSLFALIHGINPITTLWLTASPLRVVFALLLTLPVNALWALPTVGWLLLCSAAAKRLPFLWAVLTPVAAGVIVNIFGLMRSLQMPDGWFWQNVVGRLLLSEFPGTWVGTKGLWLVRDEIRTQALGSIIDLSTIGATLARPGLWIGAAVGVAMIAGAVYLRRWRDDS